MQQPVIHRSSLFILFILISSMVIAQDTKKYKEVAYLQVDTTNNDILAKDKLDGEFASTQDEGQARGLTSIASGYLLSKGVAIIQQMIDARKKKFTCQYAFAKGDLDFYDRVSTLGSFDPTGLRFRGFTIVRLRKKNDAESDTVFLARFVLDTSKTGIKEIMNDGVFKLKMDSLVINKAQVKKPKNVKKLNMDFEIDFISSYRTINGQIFADVPLGKFVYTVRDAPINGSDILCRDYYAKKRNDTLTGECFIVPRSVGYFKNRATGKIEQCWGRGMYSIKVTVTETSKNKFIDKILLNVSDPALAIMPAYIQTKITPSTSSAAKTATVAKPVSN